MKKEVADKWIADLRTNPPQTSWRLYDGKGYCCLGRLCVVLGREFDEKGCCEDKTYILPKSVKEEAGMNNPQGGLFNNRIQVGGKSYCHLSAANDDDKTFVEIAAAIKQYWEIL